MTVNQRASTTLEYFQKRPLAVLNCSSQKELKMEVFGWLTSNLTEMDLPIIMARCAKLIFYPRRHKAVIVVKGLVLNYSYLKMASLRFIVVLIKANQLQIYQQHIKVEKKQSDCNVVYFKQNVPSLIHSPIRHTIMTTHRWITLRIGPGPMEKGGLVWWITFLSHQRGWIFGCDVNRKKLLHAHGMVSYCKQQ